MWSLGVMKSTNGGQSWQATGLAFPFTQYERISRVQVSPGNHNTVLVATHSGIYKSDDAGATFTQTKAGWFKDMEYRPGHPETVYAAGNDFYVSTDSGNTFVVCTGFPPMGQVGRMGIAVTPANDNYVYVLASDASNNGLLGVYRSTNRGTTFTLRANSPNLMGYDVNGTDVGGQAWYTLALAASPTDAEHILVGGVNVWGSTDGGTTYTCEAHWYGANGLPYVHADQHDIQFAPGSDFVWFAACDGGVFKTISSGNAWADIGSTLNTNQFYGFGQSMQDSGKVIGGLQDNGTVLRQNNSWDYVMGGDGMQCFIDPLNDQIQYGSIYYGALNRSDNNGVNFSSCTGNITEGGAWVTPWSYNVQKPSTLYAGFKHVWKTNDRGNSWAQLGNLYTANNMATLTVAPSDSNVLYVSSRDTLWRSSNGGANWQLASVHLGNGATIKGVAVNPTNPQHVFLSLSGYNGGQRVYVSKTGGGLWTNYSQGLPNLPTNCLAYWPNGKHGLFVGLDVGIYYRDTTMAAWVPYGNGLPNVTVNDIKLHPPTNMLRVGTYGRGLWEIDLTPQPPHPPLAQFVVSDSVLCAGASVQFTDQSYFSPTTWAWTFQGGVPASSTQQNPTVVFSTPGTHTVTLAAANANGTSTLTKTGYIVVSPTVPTPFAQGFEGAAFPPTNWASPPLAPAFPFVWEQVDSGAFPTHGHATRFDNYTHGGNGQRVVLSSPNIQLPPTASVLTFDLAYASRGPAAGLLPDSLMVSLYTNCSATPSITFLFAGANLATAPNQPTGRFQPTWAQWKRQTLLLNGAAGQTVRVAFTNIAHGNQPIYIDNVNILDSAMLPNPAFAINGAQTVCENQPVFVAASNTGQTLAYTWHALGATPATATGPHGGVPLCHPGLQVCAPERNEYPGPHLHRFCAGGGAAHPGQAYRACRGRHAVCHRAGAPAMAAERHCATRRYRPHPGVCHHRLVPCECHIWQRLLPGVG